MTIQTKPLSQGTIGSGLARSFPTALQAALVVAALVCACLAGSLAQPSTAYALDTDAEGTYLITSAKDLIDFATVVTTDPDAAVNGKLIKDIDLNPRVSFTENGPSGQAEPWSPIPQYKGTFDGANHTIRGLYVSGDQVSQGLFGILAGTVKNLGIVESYVQGDGFVGAICGENKGGLIENCYNTGVVAASFDTDLTAVGGVCGMNAGGIADCYNTGAVSASSGTKYALAGGIAGASVGGIKNCSNRGKVSANSRGSLAQAGGICGSPQGVVNYCSNTGEISANSTNSGAFAGGICGRGEGVSKTVVKNSNNAGQVTAHADAEYAYAGGVCGTNRSNSTIEKCFNTAAVSATAQTFGAAGGVCGVDFGGPITNCYNSGAVFAKSNDDDTYSGGICGGLDTGSILESCYNIGAVSVTSSVSDGYSDGVCPRSDESTITNCYYLDSSVSGAKAASGAMAKTQAQFASGEVAWLLDRGSSAFDPANLVWGQKIGNDAFPLFIAQDKSNAVYQVSYDTSTLPEISAVPAQYGNAGSTITLTPVDGVKWLYDAGDGPQAVAQIILSADTQVQAASTSVVPKPEQDPEKKPTTNNTTNNTNNNATRLAATGDAVPISALASLIFAALVVSASALGILRFKRR